MQMEICFISCIITVDTLIILEVIKKYARQKMSVVYKFVN